MPTALKMTIGLLLTLIASWAWHAPLGHGDRLLDRLQAQAEQGVAATELPGIEVRLSRDPLARTATLSGPADEIQREGLGSQMGISDHVRAVDGVADVRWADAPEAGRRVIPLLAETSALAALAYLIGLGLGWLLWGRRRREGYA